MGKLHKIRRAFDKLSDERKRDIWHGRFGCVIRPGEVVFTQYWRDATSYQRYIDKISEEWIVKHLASRQNSGVALRD